MKKILVTGGMGFIGGHLVQELLSQGLDVIVLDKSVYKPVPFDISKVQIVEADVLAREILKDCLKQVDTCLHLAAISSLGQSNKDWMYSHQNNVLAFNILLDLLRELQQPIKLVYASSAAVYGNNSSLPLSENMAIQPVSAYGADKYTNEIYAQVAHYCYSVPSIGLRLFNVYGPGQPENNPYSGVITCFKKCISRSEPINIYGNGEQTRDFIYVKDVVRAFLQAAQAKQELAGVFNVCTGTQTSIKQLAELMMHLYDVNVPFVYKPSRLGDLLHSCGNKNLANQHLGFQAKTSMKEGLTFLKNS